jgi:hypothetical protein
MRHALLSVLGAAALGLGALTADALTAAPAQAQGFTITVGEPYGYNPYPRHPRRHWGHWRRHHRPVYYRPVRGGYGPDCTVRMRRYFDGYSWVTERRRTCW